MQSTAPSTNSLTFELLELAWWQNPWYYVAIIGVLIILIGCALVWYYMHRRILSPEEKLIARLQVLHRLPVATQQQQKYIYELLTRIMKEFTALVYKQSAIRLLGLTDQEFLEFIQKLPVSEQLIIVSQKIITIACSIKFAEQIVASDEIAVQIAQLQQVFAQIVEELRTQA